LLLDRLLLGCSRCASSPPKTPRCSVRVSYDLCTFLLRRRTLDLWFRWRRRELFRCFFNGRWYFNIHHVGSGDVDHYNVRRILNNHKVGVRCFFGWRLRRRWGCRRGLRCQHFHYFDGLCRSFAALPSFLGFLDEDYRFRFRLKRAFGFRLRLKLYWWRRWRWRRSIFFN
jgi:hypothetical protein